MTAARMPQGTVGITIGVDTHADVHVGAAFNHLGQPLGHLAVPTTPRGYASLLQWASHLGDTPRFALEGTGSYGAGLARYLVRGGYEVVEVNRPNRQLRRARGKSDPVDAEAAARALLAGEARGQAKSDDHYVGMIRALRVARRSAVKMRTQIVNQMKALIVGAPSDLRERLRHLDVEDLIDTAAGFRAGTITTPAAASKFALRGLAARHQAVVRELAALDRELDRLTLDAAPSLRAVQGVGVDVAGALLVAAGDNPERLRSEAAFANLCGSAPIPASSGKTTRHRLNRGGDRSANNALWRIVMVRLSCDARTREYADRRTKEGLSKRDIIRCLKRFVAREIYHILVGSPALESALDKA